MFERIEYMLKISFTKHPLTALFTCFVSSFTINNIFTMFEINVNNYCSLPFNSGRKNITRYFS